MKIHNDKILYYKKSGKSMEYPRRMQKFSTKKQSEAVSKELNEWATKIPWLQQF